ncbi:maleylpyruvate isomerase family mycothiol-dependent enzyme [Xylanimonas allomyrinae]|uniref:Maleylpyruvate isomerase family mycothiol-dependent enzyme n=1 Tax=Xylanimonas allomyrinae TaxID=2509459 RepID=A0A4P6EKP1_9MICO|nr:maleylpyruvate isomerase family mycothiol-dependent enzyme [Xylanimonas allomyrinae]QAY62213.1 maleylpyruvate isomerase family mycothiol-dependent enzyme [Xylanimonas allomyrinae]
MSAATGADGVTWTNEDEARALLRARQGAGARYDSPDAPRRDLAWARRGTAYFARVLASLTDDELYEPSLLPGWTRAHVISHVGYNARALTRLVSWARTGVETPMYRSAEQRGREIERGSTLPARALRFLFAHAEVHLNVEWRDVAEGQWENQVVTIQGRTVPVRETAWMRTREVWVHAMDLDTDAASYRDVPPDLLDALLADVLRAWDRRGEQVDLVLALTDRTTPVTVGTAALAPTVTGTTADVVRWLTGRGARRLTAGGPGAPLPTIPRWF